MRLRVTAIILVSLAAFSSASATGEDTPKDAMARLMAVIAAHDAAAVRQICAVDDPRDRPLVDATADMLVAGRMLADAASKRFGPAAHPIGKGPIAAGDEKDIASAKVSIVGDKAELVMPGHTFPVRFVRRDGSWKLKVVDFAGTQPRDPEKQAALVEMFGQAMREAAEEIEQDRYATPDDAEAAIRQKLNFVLMRSLGATTAPSTAPG
ncbi:MAG: hypothetical protein NZ561_04635 [Phycisphaerae bacterium]|nr:hypothetical protein [Phycisphaerae bacterium]